MMQILKKTNWAGFKKAKKMSRAKVIKTVKDSGLRGRSGSNYPTGVKWEAVSSVKGEKYLICNADEGEPGTFKDRFILDKNPALLIEGIAIASYAMDAHRAIIYLRGEYSYLKKKLERQIKNSNRYLKQIGLDIKVVLGAGAYICGEESAILESIEGHRPIVRKKPPYPAQYGLYGKPTCINNVETLANVPLILSGKWNPKLFLFCISGDVRKPGVYELETGMPLGKVLSLAKPKENPKAVYFGAAGGCLPYKNFENLPLDDKSVADKGAMLGSRALIIAGESRSAAEMSKVFAEFFVHESCGYCTPCREGTFRILEIMRKLLNGDAIKCDLILLDRLAFLIRDTSYCGLGKTSTNHILCGLKYFNEDFYRLCK